ncbi:hypothetical protein M5G07_02290 [Serratia symbiotica]|nr:hypothetical protein [Serratia symbiotica]
MIEFDTQIQIDGIGMVRLSRVEDVLIKSVLSEEERIMLSDLDRLESIKQMQNLERL